MIIEHTFNICILISLVLASLVLYVLTLHARPLVVIYSLFIEQIFMSKIDLVGGKSIYERVRMQFHPKPPPPPSSFSLPWRYIFNHCHCAFFYPEIRVLFSSFVTAPSLRNIPFSSKIIIIS